MKIRHRKIKFSLALSAALLLFGGGGCSSFSRQKKAPLSQRLERLEGQLQQQAKYLADLQEENLALKSWLKGLAKPAQPEEEKESLSDESLATSQQVVQGSSTEDSLVPAGEDDQPGDRFVYASVISAYRTKSLVSIKKNIGLLLKAYPHSVHADNALFLLGQLQQGQGAHDAALVTYDRIIENYPHSNKVPSALLGKALVYKKLQQFEEAHAYLESIQLRFPGSLEAFTAQTEMQLIEEEKRRAT